MRFVIQQGSEYGQQQIIIQEVRIQRYLRYHKKSKYVSAVDTDAQEGPNKTHILSLNCEVHLMKTAF